MSVNGPVLLVNAPLADESTTSFFIMPMGILSIASFLRYNGECPVVLDLNVVKRHKGVCLDIETAIVSEFEKQLKTVDPVLVGVSVMIAGQFKLARKVLQKAKEVNPNIVTVLGGANSTQFPEEILNNCPEVDIVVLGEGEFQMLACVQYARTGSFPNQIPDGIAFRKNESTVVIPKASFIGIIDDLPIPAYDLVDFNDYKHDSSTWHNPYNVEFGTRVPIITSRGCPNRCNFCSVGSCMGSKYRAISATKIVDMIQLLVEEYDAYYFAIFDANFTQDVPRVIEACNELFRRNIKICLDLPTGVPINRSSSEMLGALVSIGLIRTGISIESGDAYVRNDIMKKNVNEEDIFIILDDLRKYPHVHILVDFVLGMPEDTIQGLEASCSLIEKIDVDSIALSVATPYPGTPMYKQCVDNHLFFDDIKYDELWNGDWFTHANVFKFIIKPPALSKEDLYQYRDRILKLRDEKVIKYKRRMKELFNVNSMFEPEKRRIVK
jgi:radical SAM superfamily enzyme YgiQ (UPF0313 family)